MVLAAAGASASGQTPQPVVAPKAQLFALREVRLLDGPLQRQQELNRRYLLRLEPDRLLSWFRREAGLAPKAPPYRGWESEGMALPGHILGFYLSGAAMTVQATGDETLRRRLDYIVGQLAEVQAANRSGYMLALDHGKEVFAEIATGRIRIDGLPWNGHKVNGHFEPTYTMNKLMLGLVQVYRATGDDKPRQVFLRLADWFGHDIVDKLDDGQLQTLMQCEHGSLPESYADAFELTGDRKYLAWARRLCHERMLGPLADNDREFLTHFHANSNIPKYTAFERVHRFTGEPRLHSAAANFWDEVVGRRSWVIGGNSANEHFFDPREFKSALNALAGPESCNSVNMLRLTEALFCAAPSARHMDYYERTLFNHLLAAHDPEQAMCCYYTTMRPGGYRVYSDPFDSMWCCTGTGLEAPGKYAQMIFSRAPDDSALDVNLFAAAELRWAAKGVTVRQTTAFPQEEATTLTIRCARPGTEFTLRIRHPWWVPDGQLRLTVNDKPTAVDSRAGLYAEVRRAWRDGDFVGVALPMHLTAEPLPGDDHYVALLYGPIVLSGELGLGGLAREDFRQVRTTVGTKLLPEASLPIAVADSAAAMVRGLRAVDGQPLHFRTGDLVPGSELSLIPFFENHFQRYVIYWHRLSAEELRLEAARRDAEAAARAELDARTVDRVLIGDAASEKAHSLQGLRTESGGAGPHRWRDARNGGWFSYELKTAAGPLVLRCEYWGRDAGARTFDVLIDGQLLETRTLRDTGKDDLLTVDLPLPDAFLQGRAKVILKFRAKPGNTAGGLFGLRILRAR